MTSTNTIEASLPVSPTKSRWTHYIGAWLGIGTAPGSLLIGARLADRHAGAIPLLTLIISLVLMFTVLWFQGSVGMAPPVGEGTNLHGVTQRYFGKAMQRIIGGVIAIGMIGWFGFNAGLGGAALSALLKLHPVVGPFILGVPILVLSLMGLRSWNGLATIATVAVVVLVVLVSVRLAAPVSPVTPAFGPVNLIPIDVAVFLGYISVFSVRSPDFSANLTSRRDLLILIALLIVPVILIALAGVGLYNGTNNTDLVAILAAPGGLAIGNLLVTLSVIAPTFTILYSGAPGLRTAIGLNETIGMFVITGIGLVLAIARFDLWLLSWLSLLSAMLPPLIIPLAVESTIRRHGGEGNLIPIMTWLPGSVLSVVLTAIGHPMALLAGLGTAGLGTGIWRYLIGRKKNKQL